MPFKLEDWVEHPLFGDGQIIEDCGSFFVIQFVAHGEKKIDKKFRVTQVNSPYPGFTFYKAQSTNRSSRKGAAKEQKCFTCEEAFPFIYEVIERLCEQFRVAEHDAIVEELMRHPEASAIIELATVRCPHFGKQEITSNMVQWMSQHYTQGNKDADVFAERFQRHKDGKGRWAYSLR